MNIFALDSDPNIAAKYHVDKHVVKMILEYCQLLSTAHRVLDGEQNVGISNGRKKTTWKLDDHRDTVLYSATHINHPSAIWCRTSDSNYNWLHSLLVRLSAEYTYRYGKVHKCQQSGLIDELKSCPRNIPIGQLTQVTPAMPTEYVVENDSIESYRNYYIRGKSHICSWSGKVNGRGIPIWYTKGCLDLLTA
jgi:hypothetical protein